MYKIYERPGAGSTVVEAVLAEAGEPYELIRVDRNPDTSIPGWFRKINPRGEVPTIVLPDGTLMMESAAMTIYLSDLFPAASLAPPVTSPLRRRYLQWIMFFATAGYGAEMRWFWTQNFCDDENGKKSVKAKALAEQVANHAIFAQSLGQGPYILGETFSAADIYAAMILTWSANFEQCLARHPNIRKMYECVAARPKLKPVFQRNKMPV